MVGSVFIRPLSEGADISCDEARGYDGELIWRTISPLRGVDLLFSILVITTAVLIRAAGGIS